jgi:hypothetical protein
MRGGLSEGMQGGGEKKERSKEEWHKGETSLYLSLLSGSFM